MTGRRLFGKPSQISILIIFAVGICGLVVANLSVPGSWGIDRILRLSLLAFVALCAELYALVTFVDLKTVFHKINDDRIGHIFAVASAIVLFLGLVHDLVKVLFNIDTGSMSGFLFSLYANLCLYLLIAVVFRKCGVRFSKSEKAIGAFLIILACTVFCVFVLSRKYIYTLDSVIYYESCLDSLNTFGKSFYFGLANIWWSSNWDYSWLLNAFTMFFVCFTTRTPAAFCASLSFSVLLPFLVMVAGLSIKILNIFRSSGKRRTVAFCIGLLLVLAQPQIYYSLFVSQPDMFGLVFALMLALCLVDFDFSYPDRSRCLICWVATVALLFTRRWYAFFVVSFWIVYAICMLIRCGIRRSGDTALRFFIFALISLLVASVFLFPLVLKVTDKDYASDYSSWLLDSLSGNFHSYYSHCGYVMVVFCLLSYLMLLFYRRLNPCDVAFFACMFLPLCLFHLIQSAGYHQLLILAPAMIFGILALPVMVLSLPAILVWALSSLIVFFSICNIGNAFGTWRLSVPVFSDTVFAKDRADYDMVAVVDEWLLDHLHEYGDVYFIPHYATYTPDVFSNYILPDYTIKKLLPYGANPVSAHDFPVEILDAEYVMTSDPFEHDEGMAIRINEIFLALVSDGYFEHEIDFDMDNGFVISAYKRTRPADRHELELYVARFTDLIDMYPAHYEGLLEYAQRVGVPETVLM